MLFHPTSRRARKPGRANRCRLALAALLATPALATAPPPAVASTTAAAATYRITGLELVAAADPDVDSDPVKKVVLTCPVGKVIVGGGATAYEFYDGRVHFTSRLSITQLEPGLLTTGRYTWSATVEESGIGTNNPWYMVAIATCADRPPGYDWEADSTPISTDASKQADPACRPNRKMIGGGVAIRSLADQKRVGLTTARVDALGGLLRTRARSAPVGAAAPWGLTATVICAAEDIEGYEIRDAISSDDPLEWSRSIQSAGVGCSDGKYALTGGAALSSDAGGRATLGGIFTSDSYASVTGHESYATTQRWGFVLARMVCANADLE